MGEPSPVFVFNSFRLDVANASLWRGEQPIFLTPKAFNVLRHLVEHAGHLVTKGDLWRVVWSGVAVTDAALTVCVSEIRKALGDEPKAPRYIQTVHRLGYRFVASVLTQPTGISQSGVEEQDLALVPRSRSSAPIFVVREAELAQLKTNFEKALCGQRQIVTGEPGIGNTTPVEMFPQQVATEGSLWIGPGQRVDQNGVGEPYIPVLEALTRLCCASGGDRVTELFKKLAPSWLIQIASVLSAEEPNLDDRGKPMSTAKDLPSALRLHHNAYVVRDQRVTRRFYEDVIGLPMAACWTERDEVFGGLRVYCHTFFELADGGALAFFQFESVEDYERFGPQFRPTPFVHIALKTTAENQAAIAERLTRAGYENFVIDHGYCSSLYATDPDGLNLEFTVDDPRANQIYAERMRTKDADLERWLRGDHSSNNNWRRENSE